MDMLLSGIGMLMHFDVLLDPEDKIDGSTDHLRYRYVDFLTLPGAKGILDRRTNSADIEDVRSWLDEAKPATRIEAYPLFVVAKELLHHLLPLLLGKLVLKQVY